MIRCGGTVWGEIRSIDAGGHGRDPRLRRDLLEQSTIDLRDSKSEICTPAGLRLPAPHLRRFDFEQESSPWPALVLDHPLPDEMFDIVFEKQDRYAIAQGDIGRRGKEISDANIDRTAVDPALHLIRQRRDSAFPKLCRIGREP